MSVLNQPTAVVCSPVNCTSLYPIPYYFADMIGGLSLTESFHSNKSRYLKGIYNKNDFALIGFRAFGERACPTNDYCIYTVYIGIDASMT